MSEFNYIDYKNKFPVHLFSVDIPKLNSKSLKYKKVWKDLKRKMVEGYWVEHEGEWKWMTGPCFFYTNLWYIKLNKKGSKSKGKVKGKPFLRDLEWIKSYVHATVRGFSGFKKDMAYTCHKSLAERGWGYKHPETGITLHLEEEEYTSEEKLKEYVEVQYIDPLPYLYQYFKESMGKPLYENDALNLVDIEARGGGKSYISAAFSAHNFLTDGATDYDEYLEAMNDNEPLTSETLIGAIDTKYSGQLISKIKYGLDNLPGASKSGDKEIPSPISKAFSGSWQSGKEIIAEYKVKVGGQWQIKGTKSLIEHRSFKDNPHAANGTRAGFNVIDEVGFMGNLLPALGEMAECTADGADKFGTIWMTGTGGDMDGGATNAVKSVFYDPEANDCLAFDDIWEGTGKKIGFFIPAWMTLNQFKDEFGNTDRARAEAFLQKARDRKKKAKDKSAAIKEYSNRPLIPSEAFYLTKGNWFPTVDLQEQLNFVEGSSDGDIEGQLGKFTITKDGDVKWLPDLEGDLQACDYPVRKDDDNTGAVQIWEQPDPNAQYGWYPAGCDPYDLDDAPNSLSLGSIIIVRRAVPGISNHDKVVAEFTGRPEKASDFYETCRRLLLYYQGAICLYENEKNNIKNHFTQKNSLHLLASTPTVLKANATTNVARIYGQHMPINVKRELAIYVKEWLLTPCGDGKMNLHHIYSAPLLKELISYNEDGNFDRVIAFMLAVCQLNQLYHVKVEAAEEEAKSDPFFMRAHFTNQLEQ